MDISLHGVLSMGGEVVRHSRNRSKSLARELFLSYMNNITCILFLYSTALPQTQNLAEKYHLSI